ncbi:MAG: poly-gamma-glutamate synthase PgsB [candidate division WOR-3 bacterium]
MFFLLLLASFFIGYCLMEYALHRRNLRRIPIRIQVNGTRGKSSVTRLIAAGLRAGGLRVAAKVTGTRPRFIVGDREEYPVRRIGRANIAEELRMVRLAKRRSAQALVIECMALVPYYQWVENRLLVRPTHGVITNVRADHLDVMGPTVSDVGQALANTIPRRGKFFTAERGKPLEVLRRRVPPATDLTVTDATTVTDAEMTGFSYVEHKENVALALAVCASCGVAREAALAGMKRSLPDSGVMRIIRIEEPGRKMEVVNTMAANDPDSIGMLWEMVKSIADERVVLVNCRRDRVERSYQLAELVRSWDCSAIVATGGLTRAFVRRAAELGVPKEKVRDLGEDRDPAEVYREVLGLVREHALVFCTGNTVGYGETLIGYFAQRGGRSDG